MENDTTEQFLVSKMSSLKDYLVEWTHRKLQVVTSLEQMIWSQQLDLHIGGCLQYSPVKSDRCVWEDWLHTDLNETS